MFFDQAGVELTDQLVGLVTGGVVAVVKVGQFWPVSLAQVHHPRLTQFVVPDHEFGQLGEIATSQFSASTVSDAVAP